MPELPLAVITDLDGTLVDTHGANRSAYERAFSEVDLAFDSDLYDECFGLNFQDLMRCLAPSATPATTATVKEAKACAYPDFFHLLRPNAGLVVLLEGLRFAGVPVALATTARRRNAEAVIEFVGLKHLFSATVTGEDVARGKPAPDCYLLAASRLGVSTSDALVFEDSTVGVRAAEAAGCDVVKVIC